MARMTESKSIIQRLDRIESELMAIGKPIRMVFQSIGNPDLYYLSGKSGAIVTKQEVIDTLQDDYTVILVNYVKAWRGGACYPINMQNDGIGQ